MIVRRQFNLSDHIPPAWSAAQAALLHGFVGCDVREVQGANHRLICAWRVPRSSRCQRRFEFGAGSFRCCHALISWSPHALDQTAMDDNFGKSLRRIRSGLLVLCALGCALVVSACSQGSALDSKYDPVNGPAAPPTNPEPSICRPDHALLMPQPAPDCGFGRAALKTLDPDQWSRLKLEYELKCYKEAERNVRQRLRLLQGAAKCEAFAAQ
jgi:hypothetical protein